MDNNSPRPCRSCGYSTFYLEQVEFKNKTVHLKRSCNNCKAFIDYARHEVPEEMFIMPFGKFKGKPLGVIVEQSPSYARFFLRKIKGKKSIKSRLMEVIKHKPSIKIETFSQKESR